LHGVFSFGTGLVLFNRSAGFFIPDPLNPWTPTLTQFADYSNEIIRSSANNAQNSFRVLETFARTITSTALYANQTWPFMTLPDFEVRANDLRDVSSAEQVAFAPIIRDQDREAFEAYTVEHQAWIQQGLDYEYMLSLSKLGEDNDSEQDIQTESNTIAPGTNMEGFAVFSQAKPITPFIWKNAPLTHRAIPERDKGPLVPVWQTFPPPKNSYVVNHNLKDSTDFAADIERAIRNRTTVISDIVDNFKLFGTAQTIDLDPKSVVLQPIFQRFHDADAEVVAFLIVIKKWDLYFQQVLHDGAEPVIVVLQNSCGKAFSFEILGPRAIFLGEGDFHDPQFGSWEVVSEFSHPNVYAACNYTLRIYPTQEMEDSYLTVMPIYITLIVTSIFAFTTLVFVMYDYLMAKRQQKVMASVNATNRVVSKIFPNVFPKARRDRLIQDMATADADKQSVVAGIAGKTGTRAGGMEGRTTTGTSEDIFGSKPIAELYPEATIMFADMVGMFEDGGEHCRCVRCLDALVLPSTLHGLLGFAAWSSIREPTHVFLLLETVCSFLHGLWPCHRLLAACRFLMHAFVGIPISTPSA
jgi:hypothetical protein